ncbi:hypothetical protein PTQ27_00175 [Mannheimia sp. AT1]|uniref:Uncharacterized protein n=1 Tax=Mannheimia cairinae TaxID=3025936 RepID=A0ABT5ML26_9PAST|nr:hypothetical protein [Mannheimia cairinae]MDD0822895.1 hypothetical protein [Mannheimia cairinae]MDD0826077.1 hypothetical protein [Mannheimia cairinae]
MKGIAKSAARWIWERFSESQFSKIQSNRSKKRWTNQQVSKERLIKMFGYNKPDISLKQIAQQFDVNISTINRWAKELGWVKSKEDLKNHSQLKYQQIMVLKNNNLTWREIAQKLCITESNAKMCFKRHSQS